jgi:ATP phosphoribosyltransferase regulatory subunit
MRDLLQDEARAERRVAAQISHEFSLFGYEEVRLPAFEYLDVVSRGLGKIDPELLVRFVEPETGEVVALRPDMTPQVARLVASRWPDAPMPLRLSYYGSILRRRQERARNDFQVLQAGIELVGAAGSEADFEVISATVAALTAVGLEKFVLDLGHGGLSRALLRELPEEKQRLLLQHLAHKDQVEVEKALRGPGLDTDSVRAIVALPELQGGPDVLARAEQMPGFRRAAGELRAMREVVQRALDAGLGDRLVIDLGETSSTPYYTGVMFQVLAEGPGQAVAAGGRYDELYSRFGIEREAAGAAINIDHLRWALGDRAERKAARILVLGSQGQESVLQGAVQALRAARRAAVAYAPAVAGTPGPAGGEFGRAVEYARLANFTHIVQLAAEAAQSGAKKSVDASGLAVFRVDSRGVHELSARSIEDLLALVPGTV